MVRATAPRFRLLTESLSSDNPCWHFVLQSPDGDPLLEASDQEPGYDGDWLDLLALVRGLESLEQPSRLTLVTPSRYVRRGLNYGLDDWRRNGWQWESFGLLVPVKNADLWQRVDRALGFHELEGRNFRIDPAHTAGVAVDAEDQAVARPSFLRDFRRRPGVRIHRLLRSACETVGWQLAQFGTPLMREPWRE
jgi:ribonuclease HI